VVHVSGRAEPPLSAGRGETRFQEMKRFVRFAESDSEVLAALAPVIRPHVDGIVDGFYERLSEHAATRRVLNEPARLRRLKTTLREWLHTFFDGPHDEVYYQIRSRIGRAHVAIGLQPRYMALAMHLIRADLRRILRDHLLRVEGEERARTEAAINAAAKLCDIELAVMLETFSSAYAAASTRRERLATIGQISASISHEVKNPLGVIASSVYLLREHCDQMESELGRPVGEPVKRQPGEDPAQRRPGRLHRDVAAGLSPRPPASAYGDRLERSYRRDRGGPCDPCGRRGPL
jgi:signal transduction histidine kinase